MLSMEELIKENEELKNSNAVKSDLISISAHQLRTSLSAMKWIVKMFLDGDFGALNSEQTSFMKKVFDSDERMIRTVNEMLSVNHSEETLSAVHLEPIEPVKLIDDIIFDFTGETHKRELEIIFLKPTETISPILADKDQLIVIVQNLIENAIKYSKSGGKIFISLAQKENMMEISVRDTGIGITSAEKEKIFQKFFRADNAKKQDVIGSGLGLYTTKRMVERHGGKIWFESEENVGTTFYVSLPLAK